MGTALQQKTWRGRYLPQWGLTALVAFLVIGPLFVLVAGSLSPTALPTTGVDLGELSLENYRRVYTDPLTYSVVNTTIIYVVSATALGTGIALLLAFLVARTNVRGKWLAFIGIPLNLMIPGILESMAWVILFSPNIGFINKMLMALFNLSEAPIDIYGLGGMIALEGIRVVPTAFLMLMPLMMNVDSSYEEAAHMSGASARVVARKITLPLLLPGLLAVSIYQLLNVLSSFEVPGLLGLPAQKYVFSTLIYTYVTPTSASGGGQAQYGAANALSMLYVLLAIIGLALYMRATKRSSAFAVITGKGFRPRLINLGRWRGPALAFIIAFIIVSLILPVLTLLWTSFTPFVTPPSLQALDGLSGNSWRDLLGDPRTASVAWNTTVMVVATATVVVAISLAIGWASMRTRFPGRKALDQLAFMPHALPGLVIGLAMVWVFLQIPGQPLYGTVWIIVVALIVGYLAYGSRAMSAAILQIHTELVEATAVSGANSRNAWRRVIVPLLMPAATGLWIWVALGAVRITSVPLILHSGKENVVTGSFLWSLWQNGEISKAAAFGVALIVILGAVTGIAALGRLGSKVMH